MRVARFTWVVMITTKCSREITIRTRFIKVAVSIIRLSRVVMVITSVIRANMIVMVITRIFMVITRVIRMINDERCKISVVSSSKIPKHPVIK